MFNHIIVGVDDHEGGRDAIALAQRLLAPNGKLELVYVQTSEPYVYRGVSAMYEADERERMLERLKIISAEEEVEGEIVYIGARSVGRALHELAERERAGVIVLGSCRRSLVGRVLIGDDTRAALNGAPCAIAIAPAGYAAEPPAMREIGVGYDGSPESEHALSIARDFASEVNAKLSAFEVVSVPRYVFGGDAIPTDESIEEFVKDACERVALLGVEPHAAYGHPAEELAVYSASIDLLVVGSRGYGPVGRLIHGSTSHQLAHTARCPLLVLTRSAHLAGAEHEMVREAAISR